MPLSSRLRWLPGEPEAYVARGCLGPSLGRTDLSSLSAPHVLTSQDSLCLVYIITRAESVTRSRCDPGSRVSLASIPAIATSSRKNFPGHIPLRGAKCGAGPWCQQTSLPGKLQFKGFITGAPHPSPELLLPHPVPCSLGLEEWSPFLTEGEPSCISLQSLSASSLHRALEGLSWPFCLGKPANPCRCFSKLS